MYVCYGKIYEGNPLFFIFSIKFNRQKKMKFLANHPNPPNNQFTIKSTLPVQASLEARFGSEQALCYFQAALTVILAQLDQNSLDDLVVNDHGGRGQETCAQNHRFLVDPLRHVTLHTGNGRQARVQQAQPAHVATADQIFDGRQHHVGLGREHVLEHGIAEQAYLRQADHMRVLGLKEVYLDRVDQLGLVELQLDGRHAHGEDGRGHGYHESAVAGHLERHIGGAIAE